jgi:dipeptidyl aminopeptidase/acylaminoacyl peptidase
MRPLLLAYCLASACAQSNSLTAEDLVKLWSYEPALSPSGRLLISASRGEERKLTIDGAGTNLPGKSPGSFLWSPDGSRFAYFATEGGKRSLFVSGAGRICEAEHSNAYLAHQGSTLAWSPDGKRLAFAGTLEPAPPMADPVVITRVLYKSRKALSDNRRTHVYVVDVREGSAPRALTSGEFDEHSISWGGDGSEIVFVSNREKDPDANLNYDIYAVNVGTGAVRQITKTAGVEMAPAVSPDGLSIAYIATTRRITTIDSVAEDGHVWVVPFAGGTARELNRAQDRRSFSPRWSRDGASVLYLAGDRGRTSVFRVPAAGGAVESLTARDTQVTWFDGNYTVESGPTRPPEVFRDGAAVTHGNDGWQVAAPETFWFPSFDGTKIQGWIFFPAASDRKAPVILSIHGGPHSTFGFGFNPAAHFYAARGYATVMINPRGSNGYGQRFSDGSVGNWGGGDYKDLMTGLDFVLKKHAGRLDPERLGVTGASYGGFMTNWVITQTPRFKAAVPVASLSNLISFYATSLYQDLVHAEFNGYPWDGANFDTLWRWSPLRYVKNVRTPTLLLHGENDNDVHITQAEEMYTALRQRGIEAVLVRYPREGHGFTESKHRVDAAVRTVEWMDRYLR